VTPTRRSSASPSGVLDGAAQAEWAVEGEDSGTDVDGYLGGSRVGADDEFLDVPLDGGVAAQEQTQGVGEGEYADQPVGAIHDAQLTELGAGEAAHGGTKGGLRHRSWLLMCSSGLPRPWPRTLCQGAWVRELAGNRTILGVSVGTLYNHIPDLKELRYSRISRQLEGASSLAPPRSLRRRRGCASDKSAGLTW
jgi:hypothetical protein